MGRLAFPDVPPGPLLELMQALHRLHARAGWPSVRTIAGRLKMSHFTIHQLFTSSELPKATVLLPVVEYLAELAPRINAEDWCNWIDELWDRAERFDALQLPVPLLPPASPPLALTNEMTDEHPLLPSGGLQGWTAHHRGDSADLGESPTLPDITSSCAVLIGGSTFYDTNLPDLPGVRSGIENLRGVLCDPAAPIFSQHNTATLIDPRSPIDVLNAVQDASTKAQDTLLLHLACHATLSDHGGLLLATADTKVGADHTSVDYVQIQDLMARSQASRSLIIIDACYSGHATRQAMGTESSLAGQLLEAGARYVLASSGHFSASFTDKTGTPWFTRELVDILRNGIPEQIDLLDVETVYRELRKRSAAQRFPLPMLRSSHAGHGLALGRNSMSHVEPLNKATELPAQPDHLNNFVNQVAKFGKDLRRARIAADLTLDSMAAKLGFSKGHLSNVEVGRTFASEVIVDGYANILSEDDQASLRDRYIELRRLRSAQAARRLK